MLYRAFVRIRVTFAAAVFSLIATTPAFGEDLRHGDLTLKDAYSRATPPGARTGAGYMTIENTGSEADRLLAVECACADVSEIHEVVMDDNVMHMRVLPDGLAIPAGGSVELASGGYHLMFIRLTQPFVEGESIAATLTFEKAGAVEAEFKIAPLR